MTPDCDLFPTLGCKPRSPDLVVLLVGNADGSLHCCNLEVQEGIAGVQVHRSYQACHCHRHHLEEAVVRNSDTDYLLGYKINFVVFKLD